MKGALINEPITFLGYLILFLLGAILVIIFLLYVFLPGAKEIILGIFGG